MVGFIIMWFMALPLAWLLGLHYGYGLVGIWLATSLDECIRGIIALKRWNTGIWRSKGIYVAEIPAPASINKRTDDQEVSNQEITQQHNVQASKT
jgi:hypothetical protein